MADGWRCRQPETIHLPARTMDSPRREIKFVVRHTAKTGGVESGHCYPRGGKFKASFKHSFTARRTLLLLQKSILCRPQHLCFLRVYPPSVVDKCGQETAPLYLSTPFFTAQRSPFRSTTYFATPPPRSFFPFRLIPTPILRLKNIVFYRYPLVVRNIIFPVKADAHTFSWSHSNFYVVHFVLYCKRIAG